MMDKKKCASHLLLYNIFFPYSLRQYFFMYCNPNSVYFLYFFCIQLTIVIVNYFSDRDSAGVLILQVSRG